MRGLWYEEMEVGAEFEHAFTRTVTEMDNVLFHVADDERAAAAPRRGVRQGHRSHGHHLVNSHFTMALISGMIMPGADVRDHRRQPRLRSITFPKPVFPGDTLRAESTILDKRESSSRPDMGIVSFEHRGLNQRDETVRPCRRTGMILKRPGG